ncbi:MAG: hypothetical protein DYG89_42465 [Caldilinea sp. CFX5]|nr:hypothetical protein [Caldilinea sp. CFX5]
MTPPVQPDVQALRWASNDVIALRYSVEFSKEAGCWLETWQKYQVADTQTGLKFTGMLTESVQVCEPHLPGTIETGRVAIDEIVEYKLAPDQTQWLLVATVKAPAPTKISIGSDDPQEETASFYQGFLLDRNGGDLQPLFVTRWGWAYQWSPDGRYILVDSLCYGDKLGTGFYTIDIHAESINTIQNSGQNNCEGSVAYQVSPDAHHLLLSNAHGQLFQIDGQPVTTLCETNEFVRSYTWSSGGRFAFVACGGADAAGDRLLRYDTVERQKVILVEAGRPPFKATALAISPDQRHLLFIWRDSEFFVQEDRGVWLLSSQR